MRTVNVEFKKGGKQYIFFDNDLEVNEGDNVIVETERGQQFGTIASINNTSDNKDHSLVLKIATYQDERQNQKNISDAKKAIDKANELIEKYQLDMKLIDSYYTFDRKQLVFQFLSDNRVDFRELAKSLAAIYKTRIELRQVGVRDKAKEISGIGPCGRKLCCSAFLSDLDSVGIAQVKNQNLALNPSKINGLCGRLLCCLKYEDDLYSLYRKDLPEVGDKVKYEGEEGTVISIDIPRRKYVLLTEDNNKIEVSVPFKSNEKKEEKIINDLVYFKNLKIVQNKNYFNFSLDSVILPNFVLLTPNTKNILDLCCGNAPIPLILSTKTNSKIIGVEIQKEIFDLAEETIKINNINNIELINKDAKDIINDYETDTFDLITCNPPYFKYDNTSIINKNDVKSLARHEISIKLDDIMKLSKKLLKNGGSLCIVHRTDRLLEIIECMKKNNIEPKRIRFVYPKINKESNLVLIDGRKNGKTGLKLLSPLIVHNEDGSYTDEVLKMFGM